MKLPAISLWQPWASLIFTGLKVHETRHWRPPARLIGQRIAIHAAKKRTAPSDGGLAALCAGALPSPLPYGAVIGTVTLAEVYLADLARAGRATPPDMLCGDWTPGRWLWRLETPMAIEPVPTTGRQGWFEVEIPDVANA